MIFIDDLDSETYKSALEDVGSSKEIGLITEAQWMNLYKTSDLLQIATKKTVYLIDANQLCKNPHFNTFCKDLFTKPDRIIAGHGLKDHLRVLCNLFKSKSKFEISANLVDVRYFYKDLKPSRSQECSARRC